MDKRDRSYPEFDPAEHERFVRCPTCRGRGVHVNPDIDRHGLTAEDFHEDPDFFDAYQDGAYNVPCVQCHGLRVVPDSENYRNRLDTLHETELDVERETYYEQGPDYHWQY